MKFIRIYFIFASVKISEKAMAHHCSTPAWKIPWTEEPGGLQSMGSLRVGHDWATSLSLFTFMHWRRKWQSTPVFLPRESQGLGSIVGCRLWGHTESNTTLASNWIWDQWIVFSNVGTLKGALWNTSMKKKTQHSLNFSISLGCGPLAFCKVRPQQHR